MPEPTHPSPSLRLKSYFSGTVEAAIDLARRELGEDALLINAREATPETRRYGAYEVVFGVTNAPPASPTPPPLPLQTSSDPVRALAEDVAELSRQVARLQTQPQSRTAPPPMDCEGITTDATLGRTGHRSARVMLIGPPGAGKTSTLVKIAARYGVHIDKDTHILTTDIYRVAAADQLQTLAAILGTGCDVVEPAASLPQALEDLSNKSLVLIDTPGFALSDLRQSLELVRAASACEALDIHLVLSASMKVPDALRLAEAYSIFGPDKLIFTRTDETLDYASLAEVAGRLKLPVSFLSTGQRIPQDIEPATRRRLAGLLEAPTGHRKGANA